MATLPLSVQRDIQEIEAYEAAVAAQNGVIVEDADDAVTETVVANDVEVVDVEPVPVAGVPAPVPPQGDVEDFRQQYRTLQGKYNAEVPQLHQQLRELTQEMATLRESMTVTKVEAPSEPVTYESSVTDKDREDFGDDLIDMQRRIAREVAQEFGAKITAQQAIIDTLQKQVTDTGAQVGSMNFSQHLNNLVPDFDTLDRDPNWHAWLNEVDPILRGPRMNAAMDAYNAGDAEGVAHYVGLFRASATVAPGPLDDRQTEIAKQVTPTRSASTSAKAGQGKAQKVYSTRDMDEAWKRVTDFAKAGQDADAERLESELTAAYLEGRVRA